MIHIFQYSNVYATTPKIRRLAEDRRLQEECIRFVARYPRQPPTVRDVFRMYCSMTRGTTVRDLCIRLSPHTLKINERRLVQFGLLEGFIRRIHKVYYFSALWTSQPFTQNDMRKCTVPFFFSVSCWKCGETWPSVNCSTIIQWPSLYGWILLPVLLNNPKVGWTNWSRAKYSSNLEVKVTNQQRLIIFW